MTMVTLSLMLTAQPGEALEPDPASQQAQSSPGFILHFHLAQLDQALSAPPPSGTVALGASSPFSVFLFAVSAASFPPWKQLLPQHPEIHVGFCFVFLTLYI